MLAGLVDASRLVTVVGTAGVGKTRLAIEHAAARTDGDGPWLVRLADVTDPAMLPLAVAAALGVTETAAATPDSLAKALCGRRGRLLLDNCEHLVDHVAPFVLGLLDLVPGLRVLATSRVPLGIDGERLLPLGPLPPAPAVALLIDRIRTVPPGSRKRGNSTPRRTSRTASGVLAEPTNHWNPERTPPQRRDSRLRRKTTSRS